MDSGGNGETPMEVSSKKKVQQNGRVAKKKRDHINSGNSEDFPKPKKKRVSHAEKKKRKRENEGSEESKPTKKAKTEPKKLLDKESVYHQIFGDVSPSLEFKLQDGKKELKVRDLQALLLWILADGIAPISWVNLSNKSLVKRVVVVMLDSLAHPFYSSTNFPSFQKIFPLCPSGLPTRGAGGKNRVYHGFGVFMNRPKEKVKGAKQEPVAPAIKPAGEQSQPPQVMHPITYTLNPSELKTHGFPVEGIPGFETFWKFSKKTESSKTFIALDCEMCRISDGTLQLARISIVDEDETVLYDKFIKPEQPITDYLTRWSGITYELLQEKATTTIQEMFTELSAFISEETILIGHSLENDLLCMKIIHGSVIDTSVLYPHQIDGHKHALRVLSQRYLNLTIQTGEHDSVTDALTALRLAQLFMKRGPEFAQPTEGATENIFSVMIQHKRNSLMVNLPNLASKSRAMNPGTSAIEASCDREILEKTAEAVKENGDDLIFAHLHSFEDYWRELSQKTVNDEEEPVINHDQLNSVTQVWEEGITKIYEEMPNNSLLMLFTGNGDVHRIKFLYQRKQNLGSAWTTTDEMKLQKLVEKARDGMAWIGLKTVGEDKS